VKVAITLPEWEYFSPLNSGPIASIVFENYQYLKEHVDMTIFCRPSSPHWSKDHRVQHMWAPVFTPAVKKIPWVRRSWRQLFAWEAALRITRGYEIAWIHNESHYVSTIRRLNPSVKIVLHMHSHSLYELDEAQFDKVLSSVDLVVSVSEFIRKGIVERRPSAASKVHVVHNGVNTVKFTPLSTSNEQEHPVILYVGRVIERKGVHLLMEAMERVITQFPQSKLIIVGSKLFGDNSETPYIKMLKQYSAKLGDSVVFTGYVKKDELPAIYQKATVFVCPSNWGEPFGLTNLEAMASGLPVIASHRGGIPEAIGDAGILVDPEDVDSLADNIIQLLGDAKLREHFGQKARKRAEEQFTWERMASEMRDILEELA